MIETTATTAQRTAVIEFFAQRMALRLGRIDLADEAAVRAALASEFDATLIENCVDRAVAIAGAGHGD